MFCDLASSSGINMVIAGMPSEVPVAFHGLDVRSRCCTTRQTSLCQEHPDFSVIKQQSNCDGTVCDSLLQQSSEVYSRLLHPQYVLLVSAETNFFF